MERNSNKLGFQTRIILSGVFTLGGFIALSAGDYIFLRKQDVLINEIMAYIIPFAYLSIVYAFARKYKLMRNTFFESSKGKNGGLKTFILGCICMVIALAISILNNFIPFIGKTPTENYPYILVQLIILSLCIGFFEEGLFRGVIFRVLFKDSTKQSLLLGYFVSALLFGLIHLGNLTVAVQRPIAVGAQVIYATLLGMLLAALYLRYKSFVGISILHAFVDFVSFFPRLYGQDVGVASHNISDIRLLDGISVIGVLIPSAVLGLILMRSFFKEFFAE